jgi:hypothetical protein
VQIWLFILKSIWHVVNFSMNLIRGEAHFQAVSFRLRFFFTTKSRNPSMTIWPFCNTGVNYVVEKYSQIRDFCKELLMISKYWPSNTKNFAIYDLKVFYLEVTLILITILNIQMNVLYILKSKKLGLADHSKMLPVICTCMIIGNR